MAPHVVLYEEIDDNFLCISVVSSSFFVKGIINVSSHIRMRFLKNPIGTLLL